MAKSETLSETRQKFEEWAAVFCLRHNLRTINCTPRTAELIAMLEEACELGRLQGLEEAAKINRATLEALELLHRVALQTPAMRNPNDTEVVDQAWAAICSAKAAAIREKAND